MYSSTCERGEDITSAQRRADALGLLAERALQAGFAPDNGTPTSGSRAERYQVMVYVDPETLDAEAEPGRSQLADGTCVSAETSRRIACDAGVVRVRSDARGRVLDVGRRTRTIPTAIRRALNMRDGGCRFPGCGLRFTDAHHVVHWADGGEAKLDNLVLLCRHHHRMVHEEGWKVSGLPGDQPEFVAPDGLTVRRRPPRTPKLGPDPVGDLVRKNERCGVRPTWQTPTAAWKHERDVDVGVTVAALDALDVSAETSARTKILPSL